MGANVNEIWVTIWNFSFKKMHLQVPSVKWQPFCCSLNVKITTKSPPGASELNRYVLYIQLNNCQFGICFLCWVNCVYIFWKYIYSFCLLYHTSGEWQKQLCTLYIISAVTLDNPCILPWEETIGFGSTHVDSKRFVQKDKICSIKAYYFPDESISSYDIISVIMCWHAKINSLNMHMLS